MVDIMAYIDVEGGQRKLVMRSSDDSIECKCRFKYITPVINFSYQALVDALNDAIDTEAKATNGEYVTDEKQNTPIVKEYNFDALQSEFGTIVGDLMAKNQLVYAPKVTQIVEKYLGKGRRASEATPDQAELLYLILTEIKEDLL